jgi:hypothetical protein
MGPWWGAASGLAAVVVGAAGTVVDHFADNQSAIVAATVFERGTVTPSGLATTTRCRSAISARGCWPGAEHAVAFDQQRVQDHVAHVSMIPGLIVVRLPQPGSRPAARRARPVVPWVRSPRTPPAALYAVSRPGTRPETRTPQRHGTRLPPPPATARASQRSPPHCSVASSGGLHRARRSGLEALGRAVLPATAQGHPALSGVGADQGDRASFRRADRRPLRSAAVRRRRRSSARSTRFRGDPAGAADPDLSPSQRGRPGLSGPRPSSGPRASRPGAPRRPRLRPAGGRAATGGAGWRW